MGTLYDRLIEVCRDRGIAKPNGRDIEALTGLTSGRITQIKQGGSAARLSGEALQRLNRLGYLADWIQEGRGPKFMGSGLELSEPPAVELERDNVTAQIDLLRRAVRALAREFGVSAQDLVSDSLAARDRIAAALTKRQSSHDDEIMSDEYAAAEPGYEPPPARPTTQVVEESWSVQADPAGHEAEEDESVTPVPLRRERRR